MSAESAITTCWRCGKPWQEHDSSETTSKTELQGIMFICPPEAQPSNYD